MPERIDILQELGLTPVWRLRARYRADAAPIALHAANESALAATPQAAIENRVTRIAMLDWSHFAADVSACTACGLARTRNKAVPGVGDQHAEWLFVGEAPGAEEDAKGEPFVGQAGRLLDSMLSALGMNRIKAVYIANVLKSLAKLTWAIRIKG